MCLPPRVAEPDYIYLAYTDDLVMSAEEDLGVRKLDKYDDMSATMSWAGGLRTAIVRGMPYATVWYENIIPKLTFGSPVDYLVDYYDYRKKVVLENNQTWFIYSENPIS